MCTVLWRAVGSWPVGQSQPRGGQAGGKFFWEPRGRQCLQWIHTGGALIKILLQASPVIDFGKIIIYTNNLKIIRAPMDQKELMRRIIQTEGINDWAFIYHERKDRIGTGHKKEVEKKVACNQYMQVSAYINKIAFVPQGFWVLQPQSNSSIFPSKPHPCLYLTLQLHLD